MTKYYIFVGAVLLTSCSEVVTRSIIAPDGKLGHALNCVSIGSCYEKAGKICGQNGYETLNKYNGNGWVGSNLIIKCKK